MPQSPPVTRSVRRFGEVELVVKKSRFLCAVSRVDSEDAARAFIQGRRKQHFTARHHCTAYVLGPHGETQKSSDDGEPAGTAGVPILEVLRRRELTDTVAVVTRWFGGVKLGAGGLIRAYGAAVADAIDAVGLVERRPVLVVSVVVDHQQAGRVENELRGSTYPVRAVYYTDAVHFELVVPEPDLDAFTSWLSELTAGTALTTVDTTDYVDVDV